MAWNEPGDDNNKQDDPWGESKKKSSKPKDLDEALNKLQRNFSKLMGKSSSGNDDNDGGATVLGGFFGIAILLLALLVIWGITGFFVVQPPEKAVVLRFGKYYETLQPGLHWIPRFIESETKVNVEKIHDYTYPANQDALMLTKDQNIVSVAITVQFKVSNPQDFLFNLVNPIDSMHQATASALRQVVGKMNLDSILTTGREQLRADVKQQLKASLSKYHSGLTVISVLLKSAKAPDAVKDAFDDAVKAQEDQKRYVNQAQAYAMKVEPIAIGHAKRIMEAARAYKESVVLDSKANIAPYLALLPEYEKAPGVTRERMYLDTLQNVFQSTSKILVDSDSGTNNLLYLPIQKLFSQTNNLESKEATTGQQTSSNSMNKAPQQSSSSVNIARPTRNETGFSYGDLGGNR